MIHSRRFTGALLASILTIAPVGVTALPARAIATEETKADKAARLFKQAFELSKKKDWPGAYQLLRESFDLVPVAETATNLGQAAAKLGKHDEAARYFAHAMRTVSPTVPTQTRQAIEKMLGEAKKEVTTVHLTTDPKNAELFVNGTSIGSAEALEDPVFLLPGEHVIEARADGYEPAKERIVATKGAERALSLKLAPTAATPPGSLPGSGLGGPKNPSPHGSDPTQNGKAEPNVLPVVLIGGGVALVAAGIGVGFLIASNGTESDADDLGKELDAAGGCGAGNPNADRCATLRDRFETADSQRNISTIGFIGAGVAALGTLAYVLLSDSGKSAATQPRSAQPVGSISRDGFAVGLTGAF